MFPAALLVLLFACGSEKQDEATVVITDKVKTRLDSTLKPELIQR